MNTRHDLTPEQSAALEAFAEQHGACEQGARKWREKLGDGWMRAAFPGALQQVRNQFGPTWLHNDYAWGWRATCPAWEAPVWIRDDAGRSKGLENAADAIKWSGKGFAPPPLGAFVHSTHWKCDGQVTGYFVQAGWLGLIVKFRVPPADYVEREGGNFPVHVFGAEVTFAGG
jgi:hypothetical protein